MAEHGPLSGQKLGDKYLLGNLLGQGGFGVVYQAQHLLLGRPQAVKILLEQHFSSPKFRERFLREARTLAALDHINILPVHEFGIEGSRAYLVMPYIAGGTLHTILSRQRGPLPPETASRYLEQIGAALDYAHARSVAHLDLKPLNLLVHEDGRLLLSDFGLAHLMEQGAIEGSTSLQFGTPSYMAPEHLQGQPERRSDLYALGIMLYQMLSGRVPFEGSNAAAIMLKHLTEPPPPLRATRPDLPPALDGVLAKALAKRAEDRYQTAGALVTDFKAALDGRAMPPEVGIADAPTRLSAPPLAATIQAAKPLAAWGGGEATLQAAPWQGAGGQLPGRKAPGGPLSRKSIRILSLNLMVFYLVINGISLVESLAGYPTLILANISEVGAWIGLLLTFFLWLLGLIRSAKMKTWGWFAMIFFSLPVGVVLFPFPTILLTAGTQTSDVVETIIYFVDSIIGSLFVPFTTFLFSRRG